MLREKEVLLGVTAGIAAYKTPDLVRMLIQEGARVSVVLTRNASRLAAPLTLETLTGRPVMEDLFEPARAGGINHIEAADRAHIFLVAPATANFIGKMAGGIADDALSTIHLACRAPVLAAPAMNVNMYAHPALQDNLKKLAERGVRFVGPAEGELACGWEGKGRLADLDEIVEECACTLAPKDLSGMKVLVTAGPTREHIDPIRYITNRSSGKMGYSVARVARRRGAQVCLITGPVHLKAPPGVRVRSVVSARDMLNVCMEEAERSDIIVKASAVADYRPITEVTQKIKKGPDRLDLELTENPDILYQIGKKKNKQILVGFAAETSELVQYAGQKLKEKNLDLIVANDVSRSGAGFSVDTNIVMILDKHGRKAEWPQMSKIDIADKLFDRILAMTAREKKKRDKEKES